MLLSNTSKTHALRSLQLSCSKKRTALRKSTRFVNCRLFRGNLLFVCGVRWQAVIIHEPSQFAQAMDSVFTGIFMHRAKDVDPSTREAAHTQFASLVSKTCFSQYLVALCARREPHHLTLIATSCVARSLRTNTTSSRRSSCSTSSM